MEVLYLATDMVQHRQWQCKLSHSCLSRSLSTYTEVPLLGVQDSSVSAYAENANKIVI